MPLERSHTRLCLGLVLFFLTGSAVTANPGAGSLAHTLRELIPVLQATNADLGPKRLKHMAARFGQRMNGTVALEEAFHWASTQLRNDGLDSVWLQPVEVSQWVRGQENAEVLTPVKKPIRILGLGGSASTREFTKPLEGSVVVFQSMAALEMAPETEVKGKIVLLNPKMPKYVPETGEHHYASASRSRIHGPARAAEKGAIAVLIRSITTEMDGIPHTGMALFPAHIQAIPAGAISLEDAELIASLATRSEVRIRMQLESIRNDGVLSHNLIGEFPGNIYPEQVVLVGAHMDTWDVGDGSMDNGCGVVVVMEALRMLKQSGFVPARTIRLVFFTDEEQGQKGADAYYSRFGSEPHVAAIEMDLGCGPPRAYTLDGNREEMAFLRSFLPQLRLFGIEHVKWEGSGVDIAPIVERNQVVGVGIAPHAPTYFDRHHSVEDTIDRVDLSQLEHHAKGLAMVLAIYANRGL